MKSRIYKDAYNAALICGDSKERAKRFAESKERMAESGGTSFAGWQLVGGDFGKDDLLVSRGYEPEYEVDAARWRTWRK
jgi:hypothetical protein